MSGKKFDGDKAPLVRGCIAYFPRALKYVAEVSRFGATKYNVPYEEQNWRNVEHGIVRYTDALGRHLVAELTGEGTDPESGLYHAGHCAWDALARLELLLTAMDNAAKQFGEPDKVTPEQIAEWELTVGSQLGCEAKYVGPEADVLHSGGNNGLDDSDPGDEATVIYVDETVPSESRTRPYVIGDLVKILSGRGGGAADFIGKTGKIARGDHQSYYVRFVGEQAWLYADDELELVEAASA